MKANYKVENQINEYGTIISVMNYHTINLVSNMSWIKEELFCEFKEDFLVGTWKVKKIKSKK
jgi:hypothetical protein